MRRLLVLLVLVLAACGSTEVTATRVTRDRTIDDGDVARVPAASQQPSISPRQAVAACRKEGICSRSRTTIELADVTTNNLSLHNQLAYVVTSHEAHCVPAGPSTVTDSACTLVDFVNATTGHVAYSLSYSE